MIKKQLILLAVMILLSAVSFAEENPVLTVVFMEGLEPLCWEENGKPMGEQPEIAEYVISKLGIKAKFLFLPWARAQKMVETGGPDLMMTTPNTGIYSRQNRSNAKEFLSNVQPSSRDVADLPVTPRGLLSKA